MNVVKLTKQCCFGVAVVAVLMAQLSCYELLPDYDQPDTFLKGNISGQYILTSVYKGNRVSMSFTIRNVYEETLDGIAKIQGTLKIRSVSRPDIVKTIAITSNELISASGYNYQTKRLTLDPGDSLTFAAEWDFERDDRAQFIDFKEDDAFLDARADIFKFYVDPTCPERCIALRELFVLSGEVSLFDRRGKTYASAMFPICFVSGVVNKCGKIQTDPPCLTTPPHTQVRCFPFGNGSVD